jgi:hypothetical protein
LLEDAGRGGRHRPRARSFRHAAAGPCGGLGAPLRPFLPPDLLARSVAPRGDAASGALRMIALHLKS